MFQEKTMTVDDIIQLNPVDDDDDDGENVISLDKIKAELSQPTFLDTTDKLSLAGANNSWVMVHI
jgi:hypothetical protein